VAASGALWLWGTRPAAANAANMASPMVASDGAGGASGISSGADAWGPGPLPGVRALALRLDLCVADAGTGAVAGPSSMARAAAAATARASPVVEAASSAPVALLPPPALLPASRDLRPGTRRGLAGATSEEDEDEDDAVRATGGAFCSARDGVEVDRPAARFEVACAAGAAGALTGGGSAAVTAAAMRASTTTCDTQTRQAPAGGGGGGGGGGGLR
jgi:hypothetical protein